jgi:hypothetical protein
MCGEMYLYPRNQTGSVLVQASYPLIPNVRGGGKSFLEEGKREQHSDWWCWSLILFATPNGRDGGKGFLEEEKREQHCDSFWSIYCLPLTRSRTL